MKAPFLPLLAAALLSCPALALAAPPPLPPYRANREYRISHAALPLDHQELLQRIRADLFRVVLPAASSRPVPPRDAIETVRQGFRQHHPQGVGIGLFLKLAQGQTLESLPRVRLPARPYTAAEGLDLICAVGDWVWRVDAFALAILPLYDPLPTPRPSPLPPNPLQEQIPTPGDTGSTSNAPRPQ